MKALSLKTKILLLVLTISMITPIISGVIIYKGSQSTEEYNIIAERSLPRTQQMGKVLFLFRELRIQFRSLVIKGNTEKDIRHYKDEIGKALVEFTKDKDHLIEMMSLNENERKMSQDVERDWLAFKNFGDEILALIDKGDEASLSTAADLVRFKCPDVSKGIEDSINAMISWQDEKAKSRTLAAQANAQSTNILSLSLALFGVIFSVLIGYYFANSLIKELIASVSKLGKSAGEIHHRSNDVADISSKLSEASVQQASSLQQTVTSIDEISAMISRNSDSAKASSQTSEKSTTVAQRGKENVETMLASINSIAQGNEEIIQQMQNSNREISEIVKVIEDIGQKTKVINDIVFQTKLLSFNASVEAARAGEHGKGFAVVAEEVGNLASMSGKAATEISDMLSSSVKRVTEIVENTKHMMDNLVNQSRGKIQQGTTTANDCARSLDEILKNVSTVNEMIKEISIASEEQSGGVREVNKAMIALDQVTQQNSQSASASSKAASELNYQVDQLNMIVSELSKVVSGKETSDQHVPEQVKVPSNVVPLKKAVKATLKSPEKKVVGMDVATPSANDSRFEDI